MSDESYCLFSQFKSWTSDSWVSLMKVAEVNASSLRTSKVTAAKRRLTVGSVCRVRSCGVSSFSSSCRLTQRRKHQCDPEWPRFWRPDTPTAVFCVHVLFIDNHQQKTVRLFWICGESTATGRLTLALALSAACLWASEGIFLFTSRKRFF